MPYVHQDTVASMGQGGAGTQRALCAGKEPWTRELRYGRFEGALEKKRCLFRKELKV